MAGERRYDVALFGASGFTGALTAEYLAAHAPAGLRWALAGRDRSKLQALRDRLSVSNPACAQLPLMHADVQDARTMRGLAASARVVLSTVGPYLDYGEPVVAACVQAGTDYLDMAGESEFVDLIYMRYHELARAKGARIVHSCGFVAAAHDLGAYFAVMQLPEAVPIRLEAFLHLDLGPRLRDAFSAGSLRSALTMYARPRQRLAASRMRRTIEAPLTHRRVRKLRAVPHYERSLGAWVLPAATIDAQTVRRSAATLSRYGPHFSYGQYLVLDRRSTTRLVGGGAAAFLLAQVAPARRLLVRRLGSGTGPGRAQRERRWFKLRFVGEGDGERVVAEVSGGDPGYGEASKMLAESALSLACDDLAPSCGQLTPAVAMGDALVGRLRCRGVSFAVLEPPPVV